MKNSLILSLLLCVVLACAQAPNEITTLILVRHAEKENDGTKDPALAPEGKARAIELARILKDTPIDAIYSTPYKRTTTTVEPLAAERGLTISTYEPMNEEVMDKLLTAQKGKTVVISGHSNTTPWVANYFLGNQQLSDFKDSDYDNLIILTIVAKGNAKITWINFGKNTD